MSLCIALPASIRCEMVHEELLLLSQQWIERNNVRVDCAT